MNHSQGVYYLRLHFRSHFRSYVRLDFFDWMQGHPCYSVIGKRMNLNQPITSKVILYSYLEPPQLTPAINQRILVHKSIDTSILFISNASKSDSGFYNFSVIDSGFVSSTAMRNGFSQTNQILKKYFAQQRHHQCTLRLVKTRISVLVIDVPSEPRNVRIAEHTPNSAMLEWEPPDDHGGVELIGNFLS